ncbi:hypothetical protein EYZ11_009038 [Aspergillus tanneri]|uniref:Uncharacterized protein n=1 Tax=Aspergillus tanneri TaxID=1220188 RepID=A0A4S3JB34_9EURO|nr:hypothetical protein EYZ11_009038 [Aspergillus tanneri]
MSKMAEAKFQSQATFSGSMNQGLQMGQNMGTMNTTFAISEGATVYMGGSSAVNAEDTFLDALIAGDASIGVQIEPPEPGTCLWILPELRTWQAGAPNHPLWISGSPGCGKSVISSFILRERQSWAPPKEGKDGKLIVAGSFCDRHPNRQTPIWIMRTLLYEIFRLNRDLIDTKDPEFWQESGNPEHPILNPDAFESMESLAKLLGRITAHVDVSEVYLLVDGQYQQTQDALGLCDMVNQVSNYGSGGVSQPRWIFCTRPNGLDRLMQNVQTIDLFEKNREDIRIVTRSRVKHFQMLNPGLTESFFDEVVEILTRRAEGMFLWLSLALKSLGDGMIWEINLVKEKLQSMPYDVQAIYGTIFESIDKKMQTLLRWAYVAGRPLKVNEILVMWALQDGAKSIEEIKQRSLRPEIVRSSLESGLKALLALHHDSSIHLAHPSVKDFIRQLYNNSSERQVQERISICETHKQMAESCLAYLSLEEIRELEAPEPPVDANGMIDREKREKEIERYLGNYHFLEYSITFLGFHLRESENTGVHVDIHGRDEFFGGKTNALQHWLTYLPDKLLSDTGGTSSLSLLFISARLNLTSLAEHFISTGSALTSLVNLPGMQMLAGGASSFAMVRQQVINLPDMKGWRALHVAADSEAENVVAWLLENGAAVDSETVGIIRPGRTALHFAASKSSDTAVRIVRELLKMGANPGIPTRFGGNTPLHYAVQSGSVEIMTSLLHHKSKYKPVDPNIPNYSGVTALHKAAAVPGLEDAVDVLLQNGANPEQASSLDKVAVARGVKDVKVASTLKAVASMKTAALWKSATDTLRGVATNQTALHIAVRSKGTEETVKKILERYITNKKMVESRDSNGYTPLHAAVDGIGSFTYIKLLLESKKVDVNSQDNDGRTPLMLYIQRLGQPQQLPSLGDPATLRETLDDLLVAGSALDIKDKDGKSAIDHASQAGLAWAVDKLNATLPASNRPKGDLSPGLPPQTQSSQGVTGKVTSLAGKRLNMFSKKS